jgi:hypothetical protein
VGCAQQKLRAPVCGADGDDVDAAWILMPPIRPAVNVTEIQPLRAPVKRFGPPASADPDPRADPRFMALTWGDPLQP